MRERPILFNGPMVRAILSGQKTVTRRVIKHQPGVPVTDAIPQREYPHGPATADWYWRPKYGHLNGVPSHGWDFKCPFGQPGDRLWVRESLRYDCEYGHFYAAGGKHGETVYLCSLFDDDVAETGPSYDGLLPERSVPSIHLHRRYSRILLEITDVRVERLQAISYREAIAEGVHGDVRKWFATDDGGPAFNIPEQAFQHLWSSVYGQESWVANPWVWVVEFKSVPPI